MAEASDPDYIVDASARPARYLSLLSDREFGPLWAAQVISLSGDQLARVAVTFVVYDRTGSAALTALAYAVTYLPWLIGGPLLGGLADRYPRRTVMVTCQLIGAAMVSTMAIPGLPLLALGGLLFVVTMVEPPFLSARAALLVDILPDDRYVLASGLGQMTIQATQVLGFVLGGVLLATVGASQALLIDAASFLVSTLLVWAFVRSRAAAGSGAELSGAGQRIRAGARVVFSDQRLRGLVLLAWLAFFWVVPEALAAPYAEGQASTIGIYLAAQPTGAVVGGLLLARFVAPAVRLKVMGSLAMLAHVPLLLFVFQPSTPFAVAILALSGLGTAYNLPANAAFMQALPDRHRGQAFALVSSGLIAGQGLSIAAAGSVAQALSSVGYTIALAGALGLVAAFFLRRVGASFVA